MSIPFVVGMGVGTVFVGLVFIVILSLIMSLCCGAFKKKKESDPAPPVEVSEPVTLNRQEIIAGVSAALAEELGTDISAIRILSFKKI